MTTYDDLYETFMSINKTDDFNLPQTDEKRYAFIQSAVKKYNNRMREKITCNDSLEMLSEELDEDRLLVMIHCMKYIFLDNELTYFSTIFSPFTKEVGINNYSSQLKAKQEKVKLEEEEIGAVIRNMRTDFMD